MPGTSGIAEAFGGKVIQSGKPIHGKSKQNFHKIQSYFQNSNPFNLQDIIP